MYGASWRIPTSIDERHFDATRYVMEDCEDA